MKITFLRHIVLFGLLISASSMASATGLVWGQGNWGETDWGAVSQSVPPPSGDVPVSTKIRTVTGATTNAGFSAGAYSDNGTPAYSNSFAPGDFITMIGEVHPDPKDIGKSGDIVVVILSVVGGKQSFSFLNTDGVFESWDLKVNSLGSAVEVDALEDMHAITIFEGTLQAGAHQVALGYIPQGGVLTYTAKAIKITVK